MKFFLFFHFSILLGLAVLLTGCGQAASTAQTLRIGNGAEPKALDPHLVTGGVENNILQALFEGVVTLHPQTLEPAPGIAESWSVSDDGRVYTFTINPAAKWSNGQPITAHHVAFSLRRILTPQLGNEYAFMLFLIKNAQAYNEGTLTDFSQVGVRAVSAETLQLTLHTKADYFLSILSHFATYPVHPGTIVQHGFAAMGKNSANNGTGAPAKKYTAEALASGPWNKELTAAITNRTSQWTRPENFVGNGPFTLKSWVPGRAIVVVPSPHAREAKRVAKGGLAAIEFHPITDAQTEFRLFGAGKLDITASIPLPAVDSLVAENPPELQIQPGFGTYYFLLNTRKAPLNDVRVRRALLLATDRQAITQHILKLGQQPAYGMVPPGLPGHETVQHFKRNVPLAKQLLAQAGYPGGEGFPEIEVLYNQSEAHAQIALALQAQWKEALGINIKLANKEWKSYLADRAAGNFEICRAGWLGDYLSPRTFLEIWQSGSAINHSGWANAKFDALVDSAQYARADALLMENAPGIPIYFYTRAYMKAQRVENWPNNLLKIWDYAGVSLAQ